MQRKSQPNYLLIILALFLVDAVLGWQVIYWKNTMENWERTNAYLLVQINGQDQCKLTGNWVIDYTESPENILPAMQDCAVLVGVTIVKIDTISNKNTDYTVEIIGTYKGIIQFLDQFEQSYPLVKLEIQSIKEKEGDISLEFIIHL